MIRLTVTTKGTDGVVKTHGPGERTPALVDLSWVMRAFMSQHDLTEITFTVEDDQPAPKRRRFGRN